MMGGRGRTCKRSVFYPAQIHPKFGLEIGPDVDAHGQNPKWLAALDRALRLRRHKWAPAYEMICRVGGSLSLF